MNIPMFYFERTWWTYQCFTSSIPDEHTNVLLRAYLMNIPMFYFEHTWWTYQCFTLSIPDEHTNIGMFIRYARSKTLVCLSDLPNDRSKTLICSSGMIEVKHWYVHQVIPMFYFEHTWWTYQCFTSSVPDEHTNVLLRSYLMNIPMFYFEHTWWTYQCFPSGIPNIGMFIRNDRSKTLLCSSGMLEVKHWYVHQVCPR
jgi:hypothetical protein